MKNLDAQFGTSKQTGSSLFELYNKLKNDIATISKLRKVSRDLGTLDYFFAFKEKSITGLFRLISGWITKAIIISLKGTIAKNQYRDILDDAMLNSNFKLAGYIFFKIYDLIHDLIPLHNQFLLSFMASAELHNGLLYPVSSVLASQAIALLNEIYRIHTPQSHWGNINYCVYKLLLYLFTNKFNDLFSEAKKIYDYIRRIYKQINKTQGFSKVEFYSILTVIDIVCILRDLSKFILTGNYKLLENMNNKIERITKFVKVSRRPDLDYIVDKLSISINNLQELSTWNLYRYYMLHTESVKSEEILKKYIKRLTDRGFFLLFPSQYFALKKNILDPSKKKIVISMPTGSGKTLLAELIILSSLLHKNMKGIIVYMVPSRALTKEKYENFRCTFEALGVRVCQITGEVTFEPEALVKANDIIVTTPEKFDMLLRTKFYGANVHTLIVDEFHNISRGHRGLRIQANIVRFLDAFPRSRLVLLSAIVPNIGDICDWLGTESRIEIKWEPTFRRIGIAEHKRDKISLSFNDGQELEIPLPPGNYSRGYKRAVAYLAIYMARYGQCMLFCSSVDDVLEYAKLIREEIEANEQIVKPYFKISEKENKKFEHYLKRLRQILGEHDEIIDYFRKHIGIHWGSLPHIIRNIIESAVRENLVKFIISTSTLAEGVNLPIKTIIIPKPQLGKEPLNMGMFFNIIGRAGRPGHEAEGQVILFSSESKRYPISKKEIIKYYNAKPNNIEPIISPIETIYATVLYPDGGKNITDEKKNILSATLDTMILAMIKEIFLNKVHNKFSVKKLISEITNLFLIGKEKRKKEYLRLRLENIISESIERLQSLEILDDNFLLTEFGEVVYKTGFSPQSCKKIIEQLRQIFAQTNTFSFQPLYRNRKVLFKLFEIMTNTIEAQAYRIGHFSNYAMWHAIIDWMQGVPLDKIAMKYFHNKISDAMFWIQGILSSFVAWFFYALYLLSKYLELPHMLYKEFKYLSTYAWYGTNDKRAINILRKDISRELIRDDVLALVKILNRQELSLLLNRPEVINKKEFKKKIKGVLRYSETESFISTLISILKKKV